jgi:MFS family permease
VYISGPIWGKIVDSGGPKKPFICAFLFLLAGYSGIKYIYDFGAQSFQDSSSTLSESTFAFLLLSAVLTGAGGNAGLTSSVNVAAKSFPDRRAGLNFYAIIILILTIILASNCYRTRHIWLRSICTGIRHYSKNVFPWEYIFLITCASTGHLPAHACWSRTCTRRSSATRQWGQPGRACIQVAPFIP